MSNKLIGERAQFILKKLIEYYIQEGEPIASKTLSNDQSINLSSASIRNVLADLEENGYIYSPHTSAGRIPTTQGYRFFIDSLLTVKKLDENLVQKFKQQLSFSTNTQALLSTTSLLLFDITQHVGIVTVPKLEQLTLRHIEFLPLSDSRILTILVLNDQDVQNRIIHTGKNYSKTALEQAANYLNSEYGGKDLNQIRTELLASMKNDKENMNSLMQIILDLASNTFSHQEDEAEMMVSGQSSLIDIAKDTNLEKARSLLEMFSKKKDVFHLLDQCLNTEGVQIFIGEESGHELFRECSMVTSTYKNENDVMGILGVVGPTRMNYQHVITVVDVTARLLSASIGRNPSH